ncbi:MAG TPA: winged helix-turn-helix domain-containing protein [Pyrinomonadaceae bacterium]|nr:winged helix-turn-helix domain-containing protein [Pyrinomonadaceae bacterium]
MHISNKDNNLRVFGEFQIDTEERVLRHRGSPVDIQMKEIEILLTLTECPGRLVTKQELIERVWPDAFVEESNLSRHIYRLRRVFEELGESGQMIQTVPRRGYRLMPPPGVESASLTIERHSVTRTLIEEIEQSDPPNLRDGDYSTLSVRPTKSLPQIAAIGLAILLVFTGSLGFLAMRTNEPASPYRPGSLAVLPFRGGITESEDERFGVAIAESIAGTLGKQDQITIRPVNSSVTVATGSSQAREIGRESQVDAVLFGEYTSSTVGITLKAELIRVSDGTVIWASEHERTDGDFFRLQEALAHSLAKSMAMDLNGRPSNYAAASLPIRPDAQKLYMQGRHFWSKRTYDGLVESQRLFKAAIDADPSFALAYVGLADSQMFREDPAEPLVALSRAIELDPNLGEAFATRGFIKMFHLWEWEEAESDLKQAIELSPNNASARQWYGLLLAVKRRFDEAEMEMSSAVRIDPASPNFLTDLGLVHYFSGDFDSAERTCREALRYDDRFPYAHGCLADLNLMKGNFEAMVAHHAIVVAQDTPGAAKPDLSSIGQTSDKPINQRELMENLIRHVERSKDRNGNRHIAKARAELKLGYPDRAIASLNRAVDERAFLSPYVNADPIWDPLRHRDDFKSLITRLGL